MFKKLLITVLCAVLIVGTLGMNVLAKPDAGPNPNPNPAPAQPSGNIFMCEGDSLQFGVGAWDKLVPSEQSFAGNFSYSINGKTLTVTAVKSDGINKYHWISLNNGNNSTGGFNLIIGPKTQETAAPGSQLSVNRSSVGWFYTLPTVESGSDFIPSITRSSDQNSFIISIPQDAPNGAQATIWFYNDESPAKVMKKMVITLQATTYKVTASSNGNGSASADPASAVEGTTVTLSAQPDNGYHFVGWEAISGINTSDISNDSFVMPGNDVSVQAIFEEDTYKINVSDDGNGSGTASPSEAAAGTVINLSAIPDNGYNFVKWEAVRGISDNDITDNSFVMPGCDVEIKAVFEACEYNITVTDDGNGTASPSLQKAAADTEITLTATPKDGYIFKEWQIVSGDIIINEDKFLMPSSDVEIKAVFEEDPGSGGSGNDDPDDGGKNKPDNGNNKTPGNNSKKPAKNNSSKTPQTADSNNSAIWFACIAAALAVFVLGCKKSKRS